MENRQLDLLERLQAPRSSGALTNQEYSSQRARLLASRGSKLSRWWRAGVTALLVVSGGVLVASGHFIEKAPSSTKSVSRSTPGGAVPPVVPPLTSPTSLSPARRLAAAFRAATGHAMRYRTTVGKDVVDIRPLRLFDLSFGPVIVVERTIVDGCHACVGHLGLYYLKEREGRFVVTRSFPMAIEGDGFGAGPTRWRLTDRFTANPAVFSESGYLAQGILTSGAMITELTPRGPINSQVIMDLYDDTESSVEGDGRVRCSVKGRIANVRKDKSFDVVVTGSRRATDHYAKRNGRFVAISTIDWNLPCGS